MVCEIDFDCPDTQVCYSDVRWSELDSFCECSSWYGWTGFPECGTLGRHAKLALFIHVCEAIVCFCFLLATVRDIVFMLLTKDRRKQKNSTYVSLASSSWGILFYFVWKLLDIGLILTPEKNIEKIAQDEEKYHQFVPAKRIFIVLTVICLIFSTLHVSLLWLEIAHSTEHFVVGRNIEFQTYRKRVLVIEFIHCVILAATAGFGLYYLIVVIAFPLIFGIGISYTIGYLRLRKLVMGNLGGTSTTDSEEKVHFLSIVESVKQTTKGVVLAVYLMIVSGAIYSILILLDWRQFSQVNEVSLIYLINEIFIFAILWALCVVWLFSHDSLRGFASRSNSASQITSASSSKSHMHIPAGTSLGPSESL
mmetsp:Transcript_18496/g.22528  ORF Transcript_18496/g.22528 Transcript_18496/m.22528 type:complete len:365 (+) Transcript_18496:162-1256(+)